MPAQRRLQLALRIHATRTQQERLPDSFFDNVGPVGVAPWVGIVVLCLLFSAESLLCYAETALYIELNDLASIEDLLPLSWLGDLQGLKDTRGTVGVIFFTC
jgi:hypothetical protein